MVSAAKRLPAQRRPADSPKVEVLAPAPSVRAGLLPKSPVPVPKDGAALVVVVPNPAALLPNRLCCKRPDGSRRTSASPDYT